MIMKVLIVHLTADAIETEFFTFDDAIARKEVTSSDTSFVILRRNWTTVTFMIITNLDYGRRITGGTSIQTANSGATNLFDSTFYVMSSAYNVYKVLDNNGNATSTVKFWYFNINFNNWRWI